MDTRPVVEIAGYLYRRYRDELTNMLAIADARDWLGRLTRLELDRSEALYVLGELLSKWRDPQLQDMFGLLERSYPLPA